MKIPHPLPRFTGVTALLVVAGKQGADFYVARSGEVKVVGSLEVPLRQRSERASLFARRGGGRVVAIGAVREPAKAAQTKEFIRQLRARVERLIDEHRVAASYLYAPPYMLRQVKQALAVVLGSTYQMSFRGHYRGQHPTTLLSMVSQRRARRSNRRRVVLTKREAGKILSRAAN